MELNRRDLVAGTRPKIEGSVIVTASDSFDGYEIIAYKGMVWGLSMRSKDFGQDCLMGCKSLSGGELTSYTSLGDESRRKAVNRLIAMATRLRANGVIDFRFEQNMSLQGIVEVTAHGTAVVIEPIVNYVPTGALGTVLADFAGSPYRQGGSGSTPPPSSTPPSSKPPSGGSAGMAQLRESQGRMLAACTLCGLEHRVDEVRQNPKFFDGDLTQEGIQVKCRKCGAMFTIPE